MTIHEELVAAFRKAADYEKRFGNRTDIPELEENWRVVVTLIEELCRCQREKRELSTIKLPRTKSHRD